MAILGVSLFGCDVAGRMHNLGRSFASGAAEGGATFLTGPDGQKAIRSTVDGSTAALAASYRAELSPLIAAELARLQTETSRTLAVERESLAVAIRGQWSRATQDALRANIATTGAALRIQEELLLRRVPDDYARYLAPTLTQALVTSTDTMLSRVAVAINDRLSASTEALVRRSVAAGVEAGLAAAQKSSVWTTAVKLGTFAVVAMLLVALAWLWRQRSQSRDALDAIGAAISRTGDDAIKDAVKAEARLRRVEPYLHRFLADRRYL